MQAVDIEKAIVSGIRRIASPARLRCAAAAVEEELAACAEAIVPAESTAKQRVEEGGTGLFGKVASIKNKPRKNEKKKESLSCSCKVETEGAAVRFIVAVSSCPGAMGGSVLRQLAGRIKEIIIKTVKRQLFSGTNGGI